MSTLKITEDDSMKKSQDPVAGFFSASLIVNNEFCTTHSVPTWTDADIEKMHKLASALDEPIDPDESYQQHLDSTVGIEPTV